MLLLLRYWQPIAAAIATASIAYLLHTVAVNNIEADHRQALADQKAAIEKQCAADKQLTEENSRAYHKDLKTLADRLAAVKRVQPTRCVVPIAGEAGSGLGIPSSGEHAGQDGVTTDALYDFAGECEAFRLQIISLQSFINDVWAR